MADEPEEEKQPEAGAEPEEQAEEDAPPPPHPLVVATRERFPEGVTDDGEDAFGHPILRTDGDRLLELMEWLRDDDEMAFDYLSSLTAVDWTERSPRFDVVYHLYSIRRNHRLTVKVGCEDGEGVPTVSDLWGTADWHERECYDLYGIEFLGHPDLKRIFLPEDWEGYPLRKDYPLEGPNLDLLTRQQAAFRGGRFDRIRGDYEMSEQERQMAGPGVVGQLWKPKPEEPEPATDAGGGATAAGEAAAEDGGGSEEQEG